MGPKPQAWDRDRSGPGRVTAVDGAAGNTCVNLPLAPRPRASMAAVVECCAAGGC